MPSAELTAGADNRRREDNKIGSCRYVSKIYTVYNVYIYIYDDIHPQSLHILFKTRYVQPPLFVGPQGQIHIFRSVSWPQKTVPDEMISLWRRVEP